MFAEEPIGSRFQSEAVAERNAERTAVAELGLAIKRVWTENEGAAPQKCEEATFVDVTLCPDYEFNHAKLGGQK